MSTVHLFKASDPMTGEIKAWCNILLTESEKRRITKIPADIECFECRHAYLSRSDEEANNISDHPTRHMADIPIPVQVGETIEVNGQHFVLTDFIQELGQPTTVIFKQPSELMETRKDGASEFLIKEALDSFKNYESASLEALGLPPMPPTLKAFVDGVHEGVREILEKQKQKGPVGPIKIVNHPFEEDEDGSAD